MKAVTATLGDICEFKYGKPLPSEARNGGSVAVYGSNGIVGFHDEALVHGSAIIVGRKGSFGEVHYSAGDSWPIDTTYYIDASATDADLKWLSYALKASRIKDLNKSAAVPGLNRNDAYRLPVALPPLDDQRRIATVLDKADELRQKRKRGIALIDSLTQSIFLEMFGDPVGNPYGLAKGSLGDLIKVKSGDGLTASQMDSSGSHLVYGGNGPNGRHSTYMFEEPKIAIGRVGAYCGAVHITQPQSWITDNALYVAEFKRPLNVTYLAWALRIADLNQLAGRAAQPLISGGRIYPVEILLPPSSSQDAFDRVVQRLDEVRTSLDISPIAQFFASLQHRAFSGDLQ